MLPERLTGTISPDREALTAILTRAVVLGHGTLPTPAVTPPGPSLARSWAMKEVGGEISLSEWRK